MRHDFDGPGGFLWGQRVIEPIKTIGVFERRDGSQVRLELMESSWGGCYCQFRIWFQPKTGTGLIPSSLRIRFGARDLARLRTAIDEAAAIIGAESTRGGGTSPSTFRQSDAIVAGRAT